MKNKHFCKTLAAILSYLMAICAFVIPAFAQAKLDDYSMSILKEMKDGEIARITVDPDEYYLLPDYDREPLKYENRYPYLIGPQDGFVDPLPKYYAEVNRAFYPVISQYMTLSKTEEELFSTDYHPYSFGLSGYATRENIIKICDLPEVTAIRFRMLVIDDSCYNGDSDGNGRITAKDARLALLMSANLETCVPVYPEKADLNGDGKVTAAEARKILRVSARLETL